MEPQTDVREPETGSETAETPLADYWRAVRYVVEWADGRQFYVEQPPLPLREPRAA